MGAENADPPALGLVDELDDPSPGHLSDRPQALSSTTSVDSPKVVPSLSERFVKATEETQGPTPVEGTEKTGETTVDDPEKENRAS